MPVHVAPMQGYIDRDYRRLHARLYGSADLYYTPFIRVEGGMPRKQDINRLKLASEDGLPLVPQVIFRSADEFRILTEAVKALGYNRIDLNMGCPFVMQTRKGRGAAMVGNLDVMREIADCISVDCETAYSVKMRLGMERPDEWHRVLDVFNTLRLTHITVHPRVATQMYEGELYIDEFCKFVESSSNPVIYNGDITSPAEINDRLGKINGIAGVMIGRGLLARPSIIAEWREGRDWTDDERMQRLMQFHALLLEAYETTFCGDTQILQHIKPFWDYLEPVIGHKRYKAIHKAGSMAKYRMAVGM